METPIPVDLGRIAQDLQIRRNQVETVVQLLDEGNTVPHIVRFARERTGGLGEPILREIQARLVRSRELADRKRTILQAVEAQGRLTEELATAIRSADSSKRVDDLYLPYKAKKKSKGTEARELGLEPLALRIWNRDETLVDLDAAAAEFVNAEKGPDSTEKVRAGVGHILAESIHELAHVRDAIRRAVWRTGKIVTTKSENLAEGKGLDYRDYFAYSEPVAHIPAHRVLAINRGEKEGTLKVKLEVPRPELERMILELLPLEDHPHRDFFTSSTLDALDRLLLPGFEREVKRELTETAERHAVEVFARNLRSLLLQPPLEEKVVLAIDPGRKGCKLAVLDAKGHLLEHASIQPFSPQNRRFEAKQTIKDLVGKHQVQIVAIGNGTACREMEELISEVIAEATHFVNHPGVPFPISRKNQSQQANAAHAPAEGSAEPSEVEAVSAETVVAVVSDTTEPVGVPVEAHVEKHAVAGTAVHDGHSHAGHISEVVTHVDETPPPLAGGSGEPSGSDEPSSHDAHHTGGSHEALATPLPDLHEDQPISLPTAEILIVSDSESEPHSHSHAHVGHELHHAPASDGGSDPITAIEVVAGEESSSEEAGGSSAAPVFATALTQPPKGTVKASKPERDKEKPKEKEKDKEKEKEKDREPRPPKVKTPPPPPAPHPSDAWISQLSYIIVNESGANVYSSSPLGREELPDVEADVRGTISIGRRLLDPLTELVKVEPHNVGVGQYQHDVHPNQLKESLKQVVESCVNFVGVDVNHATATLLSHVSGLNDLLARRVVEYRKEKGAFRSREQLKEVEGITEQVFRQCAGFLKVRGGDNPLDLTWIHPEKYPQALKVLETVGLSPETLKESEGLEALRSKLSTVEVPALARTLEMSEHSLEDLFAGLSQGDLDPRQDLPKPILKRGLLKLEDLQPGVELTGTVLNVVDFGAFVDIGLKDSGLVHISQLANRYIKSPHDVVSVGDVVSVWVMTVDKELKRVSLTMIQPGTERTRGADRERPERPERGQRGRPQGGAAQQSTAPAGEGQRERPAVRGPRPEGPAASRQGGGGRRGEAGDSRTADTPATPRPGTNRIPGPPLRMQQGGRPGMGGRGGPGGGRGGFGGGRGPGGGRPGGRDSAGDKTSDSTGTTPAPKKSVPTPGPSPLSKDAIAGAAPLRSFGQLKQLFELRSGDEAPTESNLPVTPSDQADVNSPSHSSPDSAPE